MKKSTVCSAAMLSVLAGSAMAQPTVDGRLLVNEQSLYGSAKWVNSNPTGFGDNGPTGPCDEAQIGNPGAATTGIEYRIPLASLGSPSGNIRLLAFLNNQGHTNASNQSLPALPGPGAASLGPARQIDFTTRAGDQFATVVPSAGASPVIDGVLDADAYGPALALQSTRTNVGNDADASNATADGSELNGMYAVIRDGSLFIMLTGNLQSNFSRKIELFIDTGDGNGYNQLVQGAPLPDVDFQSLQNMQGNGTDPGLKFDAGFTADYYITFGAGGAPTAYFPNFADLNAPSGQYLGLNQAGNGLGTLSGGNNSVGVEIALDNANTGGVDASCPVGGNPDTAVGSEFDNFYSYYDAANGDLYIFIGGNLENNGGNIDLFFDVATGGQNTLRGDNVDIDFNGLNKMGQNGDGSSDPGLTFDSGFEADYWLRLQLEADPVEVYCNAAVLRTDGPLKDFNFNNLDYGAYEGGLKSRLVNGVPVNNPVNWDGSFGDPYTPLLQPQDGFTPQIFTNYPPRTAGNSLLVDPFNPVGVPGLINQAFDNRNTGGVTSDTADPVAAGSVTSGYELRIKLTELGWGEESCVRVAGFVHNPGGDFMSNQVLGGLPSGTENLGNTRLVNFANIDGRQYIEVGIGDCATVCRADFNGDGFLDFFDFDDFVICFEGGACPPGKSADYNGDGFADFFDYDDFVIDFETGCP